MKLGELIQQARVNANLSLAQLAEAMGFADNSAALCKWENGDREPKFANLAKLAAVLQLPISHFTQPGTQFLPIASTEPRRSVRKGRSGRPRGSKNKR